MSTDDTRDLVAGFYESFNASDIDAALAACSAELETVDPGMGTVHGHEPFREYLEVFRRAMPDAQAVIATLAVAGDTVVVEGRFVGTFTGPLASPDGDVDPTGAEVDLRFADVVHVDASKISSYHTYYDQLTLLTQLGLMGEPSD